MCFRWVKGGRPEGLVDVLDLVSREESAIPVSEVDGDQGREVCGDVAPAVGADDTNALMNALTPTEIAH